MSESEPRVRCASRFAEVYGVPHVAMASAPGRLEVLGNHTDYNAGLTLSCAVDRRCYAAIAPLDEPTIRLASSAFDAKPESFPLQQPRAEQGHWANYVLGLVEVLQRRGHTVPGIQMLIDSEIPRSAGLSSSSALEMSALFAITDTLGIELSAMEMAEIGQEVETSVVGAKTGLLDPLSALLGERDKLVGIDFKTMATQHYGMPDGWCFVAIDSGVKHDLTHEYNDRRASCEQAAGVIGVSTLRESGKDRLIHAQSDLSDEAFRCARHVVSEIARVQQANELLKHRDIEGLGQLMFDSHASSRDDFRNSCTELDQLVEFAEMDKRCIGARLSGGGFGGITIHLVRIEEAQGYLDDVLHAFGDLSGAKRWGTVCRIEDGARVEHMTNA